MCWDVIVLTSAGDFFFAAVIANKWYIAILIVQVLAGVGSWKNAEMVSIFKYFIFLNDRVWWEFLQTTNISSLVRDRCWFKNTGLEVTKPSFYFWLFYLLTLGNLLTSLSSVFI